ncbi:MAG TPA: amylo-alpha-1,6-glucosidase, partial [Candidatus Acidoferrales bacterium]|nr:amylo-alpha-1,6-glucosidase [Candidatus Acidoferrales bacterium]
PCIFFWPKPFGRLHDLIVNHENIPPAPLFPSPVEFDCEVCSDLEDAESREWLVTNGIGGYAFGTMAGLQTRSYHGLLIAALHPPLGRTLLVAKLDETARYASRDFALSTNRWADGTVDPQGFRNTEHFHLEGTTPVWTFALADALVEKRIFMRSGENTSYVLYRVIRSSAPVEMSIKVLADYAEEHRVTVGRTQPMNVTAIQDGLKVVAFDGATPCFVRSDAATATPAGNWYRNFDLAAERARGLPDHMDHFFAGEFRATIAPGGSLTIVASTEANASLDGEAAFAKRQRESSALLAQFNAANAAATKGISQLPAPFVQQLVLAADQFIASRPLDGAPNAKTILAGYPWFNDWGRDAMVALPGLCVVTGRPWIARNILRTLSGFVSEGMLPNQFQGAGIAPAYNSVDATLWYFEALRQYFEATNDIGLLHELYPVLDEMIDAHARGTRYHIHVDPADGLLFAGEAGVQLTWMDAKVNGHVVTPRIGKPIEVNALWLNATATMGRFARILGRNETRYEMLRTSARAGFAKFWNAEKQFCFDVIDAPGSADGKESALRPNQIFAISLPETALDAKKQRAVVDVCARELLTSFGLRSLGQNESGYRGHYGGGVGERDGSYHQGTVWGWLLGPFALAHLRVYGNARQAMSFLEPLFEQIKSAGLGTLSEIFDGDPPHAPNGCIAQAWTVGETLRAWRNIAVAREKEIGNFQK